MTDSTPRTEAGRRDGERTRALGRILRADEDILAWRDTGPAILRWIRTHQPEELPTATLTVGDTVGDALHRTTFAMVLQQTGWHVEVFWNGSAGWFTARLVSRLDRDGFATYPGGFLVPFDDPLGASGDSPAESLSRLGELVLEWA